MTSIKSIRDDVVRRSKGEDEFLQAVDELLDTIGDVIEKDPSHMRVLQRLVEPERVIMFRVPWIDDKGVQHVNRGFRVQFNTALGPSKGGLRFHPSVNLSIVKFLGFEQIFKNSLTGIMLGGGKGGSDFNPRGRSDTEVMRFCQSFATELYRHIGPHRDVPAGDIGVGGREIGYLFGQYKRITAQFEGVLTGKAYEFGGSLIRPEATGYGAAYFAQAYVADSCKGCSLKDQRVVVSGAGNVAQYLVEKLLDMGSIPITVSDSDGYLLVEGGITTELLSDIMELKNVQRGRLSELSEREGVKYIAGEKPWSVKCDYAFPSATQNEINLDDAKVLVANGCKGVFEGANMPSTKEAIDHFIKSKILFGPAKAVNAGGVACSGLEMAQNSQFMQWTREEVDSKLEEIMNNIFTTVRDAAVRIGKPDNILAGANLAGFEKVAFAMNAQGCV